MKRGGSRRCSLSNKKLAIFRDNLKRLQKEAGWTNKDLAEVLDCSVATVCNTLRADYNKPSDELIEKVAQSFYVDLKTMLSTPEEIELAARETWRKNLILTRTNLGMALDEFANAAHITKAELKSLENGEVYWPSGPSRESLDKFLSLNKPSSKKASAKKAAKTQEVADAAPEVEVEPPSSKVVPNDELSDEIVEFIIAHVKDFDAPLEMQKEVFRTFLGIQNRRAEEKLFG